MGFFRMKVIVKIIIFLLSVLLISSFQSSQAERTSTTLLQQNNEDGEELSAERVISMLDLKPHPEGGFYRQTFQDDVMDTNGRSASTLIYFLLPRRVVSRWHKVDAVETWHWYGGSPLELSISPHGKDKHVITLSNDLLSKHRPQGVVPRHGWQQVRSLGDWTLVGCTVAPGFQFETFVMAPEGWEPNHHDEHAKKL